MLRAYKPASFVEQQHKARAAALAAGGTDAGQGPLRQLRLNRLLQEVQVGAPNVQTLAPWAALPCASQDAACQAPNPPLSRLSACLPTSVPTLVPPCLPAPAAGAARLQALYQNRQRRALRVRPTCRSELCPRLLLLLSWPCPALPCPATRLPLLFTTHPGLAALPAKPKQHRKTRPLLRLQGAADAAGHAAPAVPPGSG